jgi:hypothetical protein
LHDKATPQFRPKAGNPAEFAKRVIAAIRPAAQLP